jgi:26S proteasome regulatory subunit N1
LVILVDKIIPYFITNNAEHDAIDLLLIVDKLEDIKQYVNDGNFSKVHMYLSAVCGYSTDQDELVKILNILFELSLKLSEYTIALRMAIKLDDHDKIRMVFDECPDELIKKQLAFNAARQKIFISGLNEEENSIISNQLLAKFYLDLAKDLEVQDPKHPREVFKVHLEENYKGGGDSKAVTLYNIYVNGFVNAGLTKDTLMIDEEGEDKKSWVILLKDKEEWQIAAVASIGLLCPWNPSTITDLLMPFIDNEGKYIKAGASLGMGICSAGINDENDIAYGLLLDAAQTSQ